VFFLTQVPQGPVVLEYMLQATHLGFFTALGTTVSAMYAPEVHGRAAGRSLRILTQEAAHGDAAEAPPTPDELFARAQQAFAAEDHETAESLMKALRDDQPLRDEVIEQIESLRLRGAIARKDARGIVRAREELVRRNRARLPAGLDAQRAIAFAYETIGEYEVANGLFRDLVARGFGLETEWTRTLAERGREVEALEKAGVTLRRFPISNATAKAAFGRAQRYRELRRPAGGSLAAGRPMDEEGLDALWSVTAHYAGTPLAAPANYALVDALRRAGDLGGAASTAEAFLRRFPQSHYGDDASFFLADVRFQRFEEAPGTEAAERVREAAAPLTTQMFPLANRRMAWSPFRERAYHLLARVQHVLGDLDGAIALYKSAKGVEDAREALAFLTEEQMLLEEIVTRPLAADTRFPVRYRNVEQASFKAYPVDLQVLFAVRKTLEGLHKIDLSGIVPAHEWSVSFKDAGDHAEHAGEVALPVKGEAPGVWLVVAKAGRHEASSLILKTDLKVVLQHLGEKVRVYVTDAAGAPVRGAYVTVSNGSAIRARGLTDGRGIYEAPGVGRSPYVVVSAGDRYAIAR
jgi:TolA-binding protein